MAASEILSVCEVVSGTGVTAWVGAGRDVEVPEGITVGVEVLVGVTTVGDGTGVAAGGIANT